MYQSLLPGQEVSITAEKRKDTKGRILKPGERQRENGSYEYRFRLNRKAQSIYAKTLEELRNKEKTIQRDMEDGIDYTAGNITVSELIDRHLKIRKKFSINSLRAYTTVIKRIQTSSFGEKRIRDVKMSDAKLFYINLHDSGLKRNTINLYHNILRPAFEMAVDDDMIRKNPFKFYVSDLFDDDSVKRYALTWQQQEEYLQFIREYGSGNYYDDIVILLGTGLRVSELYGLTKNDIDLRRHCIDITHQLCRTAEMTYFVKAPKSASGTRSVPMTGAVQEAFENTLQNRHTATELIVNGYSGFIFLDKDGMPKVGMHLQNYMRIMQKKLNKINPKFPRVTPHVLRHTFCTNMQRNGLDIKTLQYLMGHSKADITLDVYTHADFETVQKAFILATKSG